MLFSKVSFHRKFALLVAASTFSALAITCLGLTVYERNSFRAARVNELSILAGTLATNTAASLAFADQKTASDMLRALHADPQIRAARLYDNAGNVFAEYRRSQLPSDFAIPVPAEDGALFGPGSITWRQSVFLGTDRCGSMDIVSDLTALQDKLLQYAYISALVPVLSVLVTFVVSLRFLRIATSPLLQLTRVAGRVSLEDDYSLRVPTGSPDDIGLLVSAFNQMLEGIQQHDLALQKARDELEHRVLIRTAELHAEVLERVQAEEQMRRAKEAAEIASRAKSEFLANMSHEIRTPLNGVIGMTDLALDTEITSEQREYLETVKLSADSLLTVINDILDYSKVEAGRLELEVSDFDLSQCVETTLKTLALRADEKGLELLCEISPEVPAVVCGDPARLRQILVNLVGNAIKFTHQGEVSLKVSLESEEGGSRVLHFTVSDTGIGIPLDKQKSIFEPFSQADTSTTRKYGGTGLGLTISARLISLMAGRIWVESNPSGGSQFHFTLPLQSSQMKVESGMPAPPEILLGVKALIVDDNRTNQRILQGMMVRWGMQTVVVGGGEEALTAFKLARDTGEPFSLILTDLHMPHLDGFAFIERIRQQSALTPPTIVMLTSSGHRGDAERCKELGVAAYLLKPIRQSELREAIARVLGARQHDGPIPLVTRYSLQDARDPDEVLSILVAEDNLVNQRLAVRMLEKRGHRVVVAANGVEALETLAHRAFDIVFMDVQMPEMDGITATTLLREREQSSQTHQIVIALTAHAMKGDEDRCLAAGMDGYLSKPIRPQALDEILARQLSSRLNSRRPHPVPEPTPSKA
jgi:signal transduction histidine kinase/DNA-binding response OmpR family regulator